ncbi:hypothetical protein F2Q70_00034266 [Brassica cretica]|uniref:Uncharacterized protein n=1 Tax=Brassica cretica TaxID=69181 RepID=A0A8S9G8E4_BRACR|nr:hypothetical protein F2Q68_00029206 [Brassica cretica]KAF2586689.1 hypothetical protein F2Q70_00034266 [Brassica cretica]
MQRSDERSDTDASTSAIGAESAIENKLEEIHLGERRSHDGSFLKDFVEVLENLPYLGRYGILGRVRLGEQVKKGLDLVRVLFKEILSSADCDDGISYQELCQTVVQIGKENMCLKKEKSWLEDTVINLRKELDNERKKEANTSDLKKENVRLAVHIESLEKQVKNEKTRSSDLNAKLEHH